MSQYNILVVDDDREIVRSLGKLFGTTLGTTPRSHMCVRNATSHAKFVYDWAPVNETIVFVFD